MLALSIKQPWAWLIANGHKDIENRNWITHYRGQILIHAGKKLDDGGFVGTRLFLPWWKMNFGDEIAEIMPFGKEMYEVGGIVGVATLVDVVTSSESPWFRGTYGFVLKDAKPLPFIPYCGQLGLFAVPDRLVKL